MNKLKFKCLAAVVSAAVAFGANAGTFLEDLAARANRVDSSPYATGGDIILQLGDDEYTHVFTNTSATTAFTALQVLNARMLLVGGGGGGGAGRDGGCYYGDGGGGAGGMVEVASFLMAANAGYTITVGSGCKELSDKGGSLNNGLPSMICQDESTLYTALGGGGGAGTNPGGNGGSGGGGSNSITNKGPGEGTTGQGNDGGPVGTNMFCGSGGGGAGDKGTQGDGSSGGDGGPGKSSDILGFPQDFAGGGAGYPGKGGVGVGGSPSTPDGEDGLGGGGTGNCQSMTRGYGGDGIVVIRYAVKQASGDVEVEASIPETKIAATKCVVTVGVTGTGSRDSVELSAVWGYASDALTQTKVLAESVSVGAYDLDFPTCPGRTYFLKIVADNGVDEACETSVMTVTAAGSLGAPTLATSRGQWTLTGDVSFVGGGVNTAYIAIATSERDEYVPVENSATAVTEVGKLTVVANMLKGGYSFDGKTYYAKMMMVGEPDDGGPTYTNWSTSASAVLQDSGTFQLVQTGGSWIDAATWLGPAASEYGAVYPGYGATATIAAGLCGTVEVPGVFYVSSGFFNSGAGHAVTFKGIGDGAFINLAVASTMSFFTGTNVFDNVGVEVRTKNGFGNDRLGQYFGVVNGATVKCDPASFGHFDTVVDIANGGYLDFEAPVTAETTGSFLFKGAAPTLEFKQGFTAADDGTPFTFAIPAEGYETAPVVVSAKFPANGKVIVNLPAKRDLPLKKGSLGKCDIPLIRSTVGLDQEKIEFGNNPIPAPCGFIYSEDGKTLYYHYEPKPGLVFIFK